MASRPRSRSLLLLSLSPDRQIVVTRGHGLRVEGMSPSRCLYPSVTLFAKNVRRSMVGLQRSSKTEKEEEEEKKRTH